MNIRSGFAQILAFFCPNWGREFDKSWDKELLKRLYNIQFILPLPPKVIVIEKEFSFYYGNAADKVMFATCSHHSNGHNVIFQKQRSFEIESKLSLFLIVILTLLT